MSTQFSREAVRSSLAEKDFAISLGVSFVFGLVAGFATDLGTGLLGIIMALAPTLCQALYENVKVVRARQRGGATGCDCAHAALSRTLRVDPLRFARSREVPPLRSLFTSAGRTLVLGSRRRAVRKSLMLNFRGISGEVSMCSSFRKIGFAKQNVGQNILTMRRIAGVLCLGGVLASSVMGQVRGKRNGHAGNLQPQRRPKLVVLLVVDQFRADYIDKFRQQWSSGLKRLIERGAWFREAAYPYANTFTCVGHATISTGAFPTTHGIMGNAWHDRETNKPVTCTTDPTVQGVGYGAAPKTGESAFRLEVPTLADEMRFQSAEKTRVITFSLKARAAIMLAGHRADAVTWHDTATGAWVTSSVYPRNPLVEQFVKSHLIENDYGKTWAPALPKLQYLYDDTTEGKVGPRGWGPSFPHSMRGAADSTKPDAEFYAQWEASPNADAYLAQMAESVADGMKLGHGRGTDFLGISFSTLDIAGHAYGPRSHEVQDILVRLDGTIGELLAHLDKNVGQGNYVVALSADHGVAPLPVEMQKAGLDAGWIGAPDVIGAIDKALEKFPQAAGGKALRMIDGDIWLADGLYARLKKDDEAMRGIIGAMEAIPGVSRVFRGEDLTGQESNGDPLLRAAAANYVPGRSGDFIVVPKPYWIFGGNGAGKAQPYGTTHGSPYNYDQNVPVILMGSGIKPGQYFLPTTPADIAPTLAFLCGITLARPDGRVLSEALSQQDLKNDRFPAAKN